MHTPRAAIALLAALLMLAASCGSESASIETQTETETEAVGVPDSVAAVTESTALAVSGSDDNQLGSFAVDSDASTAASSESATTQPPVTQPPTTQPPTTQAPSTQPPTTVGGELDVFSLQIGDCVFDSPETEVETLDAISCSEDHDLEVYALFDLPDGDFPGNAAVDIAAENGCLERFDAYVGIPYAESVYGFTYLTPLEGGWDNLGDREVVCLLGRIDGEPNIGSAQNAGI